MAGGHHDAFRPGLDPEDFSRPVFTATLRPNQSLSLGGLRAVMLAFGLVSLFAGLVSISLGFWPIAGFFGLDVLGLYLALKISLGRSRSLEEIVVTRIEIMLARISHRGVKREWRFNPLWTRLSRREDDEYGLLGLSFESRGRSVAVARDVSPAEREQVADGLGRALASVKRGL